MKYLREVDRWFGANILPHERAMKSLARKMLGNEERAKDQVQDALVEIITDEKWKQIVNPRVYVMRLVYLRCIDTIRKLRVVPIGTVQKFETLYYAERMPDQLDALCAREDLDRILQALDSLPPQCRTVLVMRRIEGMQPQEIARRLGISESTVRKHVAKGHAILTQHREEGLAGEAKSVAVSYAKFDQG
jgi:RNA polymerase sigma factor (sigma-70 family)